MNKAKIIFMGTPEFAVPVLKSLIENYDVKLVVTQPDKMVDKKKELMPSPVKKLALENNIAVFQPEKIRKDYEVISEINPDIIITCAYGQIIPEEVLNIPKLGAINVHGSILPKYRGASPMQAALLNGDNETGITIMYMDKNMDTGDIISIDTLPISQDDDLGTLHDKLSLLGRDLLIKTLPSIIEGTNPRKKQNDEEATYTKMIKREDELLDFNDNAINIFNKIRAFSPYPLTYINTSIGEIKIIKATYDLVRKEAIGKIIVNKKEMLIGCQDGVISLKVIKPFGKGQMSVEAFINGLKDKNIELIK